MSAAASWAQELADARARWQVAGAKTGCTVWDLLTAELPADDCDSWQQRLATMGVGLAFFDPSRPAQIITLQIGHAVLLPAIEENDPPLLVLPDPWDDAALQRVSLSLGLMPALATCSSSELRHWVPPLEFADSGIRTESGVSAQTPVQDQGGGDADGVVHFVGRALDQAIELGSSDIHFETDRHGLHVKHRVDGVLRGGERLPSAHRAEEAISRIKVLAQLDITERRVPQDGRFRYALSGGATMDLRVSIMPSVHGEDAVLRLLDRAQLREGEASASLDALQFDPASVERIRDLANLPHGMLLITGPTGSGKTTTVYGILSELNSGDEKIITIEDPVEYELPGVLQIPVNERKGLTFAKGLRSILRHDPDRILVGEIRDADTAEIAVQSALTGHQVFTTVHANSLYDVTGRFRHFGLDMFGFAAALNGVVVQRLVRALCPHCVAERAASEKESAWMALHGQSGVTELPAPRGCEQCNGTGYRRRFVLAEVHQVDDVLRDLITGQHAISALREHVMQSGVPPLTQMAAAAVQMRRTSFEEVRRVVGLA